METPTQVHIQKILLHIVYTQCTDAKELQISKEVHEVIYQNIEQIN